MAHPPEQPVVFNADTLPKKIPNYQLVFRFKSEEIGLSKVLYLLLGGEECMRVSFVRQRDNWYITRSSHPKAYNLNITRKPKFGVTSIAIASRAFTRFLRQQWHHDATDTVYVPVVTYTTTAAEINLDPAEYTFPLYRLVLDQKRVRV